MKSKIEAKHAIEEGKEFKVHINWNDPTWELRRKQLMDSLPDDTKKSEIIERQNIMVIRESCFNVAMEYLSKLFTYKISESEFTEQKKIVESQLRPQYELYKQQNPQADEKVLLANIEDIAKKSIMRSLIFEEIAKMKNITVWLILISREY